MQRPTAKPTPDTLRDGQSCDVLVIGSGASGLTAALTAASQGLDVQLVDKAAHLGGCTAWSLGMLWLPCNPVAAREGLHDTPEDALRYLRAVMGAEFDEARCLDYIEQGALALDFLERQANVPFEVRQPWCDYLGDLPGAAGPGRTVLPQAFDARALGVHMKRLRPPVRNLFGVMLTPAENLQVSSRSPSGLWLLARRLLRHLVDLARWGRTTQLAGGAALAGRLVLAALRTGVGLHERVALESLVTEGGRVVGARLRGPSGPLEVRARCGVVLACGGFPHDTALMAHRLAASSTSAVPSSLAPPEATGGGVRAALAVGAGLRAMGHEPAFWAPVSRLPGEPSPPLVGHWHERFRGGYLAVGPDGRRFAAEDASNHDFAAGMRAAARQGQAPHGWLICDARTIGQRGLGEQIHGWPFPLRPHVRSGYLLRADTVAGLARAIGVDERALAQTVDRFNEAARRGHDAEHGKGRTPFGRMMAGGGDTPAVTLAPLAQAPFYAVRLELGLMATLDGLRTDAVGGVLDAVGAPIPGLFAVGNDRASFFDGHCPGGGMTLGPGVAFAHRVGRVLAQAAAGAAEATAASPPAQAPLLHQPPEDRAREAAVPVD